MDSCDFANVVIRQIELLNPPKTCRDFAQAFASAIEYVAIECDVDIDKLDDVAIGRLYEYIVKALSNYGNCTIDEFLDRLESLMPEIGKRLREYHLSKLKYELKEYGLKNEFKRSKTLERYSNKLKVIFEEEIPIRAPQRSNITFSHYLGLNDDVVRRVFEFNENACLYIHQFEALNKLEDRNTSLVIVSTPNASGKTEIGLLYVMKSIIENMLSNKSLILAIYPTKALARDQFERWKRRLGNLYREVFKGRINEGKYHLDTDKFTLVLLDGETIRSRELSDKVKEIRRSCDKPLIVFSNPQFILSISRKSRWVRNFGYCRCLDFIILDEIHFYKTYDLSLLALLLRQLIHCHACRSDGNITTKILVLSATMGDPRRFGEKLREALGLSGGVECISTTPSSEVVGKKRVYIIKVEDEGIAESIIRSYIEEIFAKAVTFKDIEKTLIFVPSRTIAERLWRELRNASEKLLWRITPEPERVVGIHVGDMSLWERQRIEEDFKIGRTKILLTVKTLEVGIDIGDVTRIIHLGLPPTLSDLIQRDGRAGRRPGTYESIVFVINKHEEEMTRKFIEALKDPEKVIEYSYSPVINLDCYFLKSVRAKIKNKDPCMGIPDKVKIPVSGLYLDLPISFYGQDKDRFRIYDNERGKSLREVHKLDVIFRYLPYMIRFIWGLPYIVRDVDTKSKRITVERLSQEKLNEIWRCHSTILCGELKIEDVDRGLLFTTSDIEITFERYPIVGIHMKDLDVIRIRMRPIAVMLLKKHYRRKIEQKGGKTYEIQVPTFMCCCSRELDEALTRDLEIQIITRGVYLKKNIADIIQIINTLNEKIKLIFDEIKSNEKALERLELIAGSAMFTTNYLATMYVHFALHIILNVVFDALRIRPDDIEHYVALKYDKDEFIRKFVDSFVKGQPFDLNNIPMSVEVVIANEADIVKKIRWLEILGKIDELKRKLYEEPAGGLTRNLIEMSYLPRCPIAPDYLESLLERGNVNELLNELNVILSIAEVLTQDIIKFFQG